MESTTLDTLNAERTDLIREIVNAVVEQVLPEVRQDIGDDYLKQITGIVNRRFDELDTATESRHSEFVRQTEARFALTATKEELSGVVRAGAENTARLDKLEGQTTAQIEAIQKRLDKVEDVQKKQSENIQQMTTNTESIRQSVQVMRSTVQEEIERDRKRQAEIDRELGTIRDAQRIDQKALREAQEDVLSNRTELNDIKTTVATETDKFRNRANSITEKMTVLETTQKDMNVQYVALDARMEAAELREAEWSAVRNSLKWLFVDPMGRKVGGALLGIFLLSQIAAIYLLFRIAAAGLQIPT